MRTRADDKELMAKLWTITKKLPSNLDSEVYLTLGMAVGTISRLLGEVERLEEELRKKDPWPISQGTGGGL